MTTSGTYSFNPSVADIMDEAFERAGIDPAELSIAHIKSARFSMNLMFSHWATLGAHEWVIPQQTQTLVAGTVSYDLPTGALDVMDMVLRRDGLDTPMMRISRDEYLEIHDKDITGRPDRYFVDRLADTPTITVWTAPENSTDAVIYNYIRRMQDAGAAANTLDIPYYWIEAMASGLAARIAEKYQPERASALKSNAEDMLESAMHEDRDRSPITLVPDFNRRHG